MAAGQVGESERKKVLIVSYNFPPMGTYGGVRAGKLAKYLPSWGWEPTVLTVTRDRNQVSTGDDRDAVIPGVKLIRAPFPDLLKIARVAMERIGLAKSENPPGDTPPGLPGEGSSMLKRLAERAVQWAQRWFAFPDHYTLWFPFAFIRGLAELKSGEYKVILSTAPPQTCHLVASALQWASGLPWVAEFRDPWTQCPYSSFTPLQFKTNRWLEKKSLARAHTVLTVDGPLVDVLKRTHREQPGGVTCVTNGYDPDDYLPAPQQPADNLFTIVYTGVLYSGRRDLRPVLEVLQELIDEGVISAEDIRVTVYGPEGPGSPYMQELRSSMKYPEILELKGLVPRSESIAAQQRATVLLNLLWDNSYNAMIHGGKTFEYLGSRRPILSWNPAGGVVVELLDKTGAGVAVMDNAGLKEILLHWLAEFKKSGSVEYTGNREEIAKYSWEALAGKMAAILDQACTDSSEE